MNCKKYELRDLIEIKNGKDYKDENSGIIPVYGTGGVIGYIDKYLFDGESILLPRKGSLDNIEYVNGKFWTIDTMYWSKIKTNIVYGKFLFLYLSLLNTSKRDTGSTLPSMTFETYYSLKLFLPEYKEQKKIADFIFKIIEKINNNNQINNNLEELMKTIYQRWFIEFEFPNEEGKPYKSNGGKLVYNKELKQEIPENWKAKKIKDITEVVTGKEDANFSTPNGKYKFFTCSQDVLLCDEYKFDGKSILIAGNGDFNVKHYKGKFNAYQRTYVLIPNDEKFYSQMYICAFNKIEAFKKGSNGSIIKFIKKSDVENIDILEPDNNKILRGMNKILSAIENNQEENDKLNLLKNFLLPLLINGQINIDDIEI